MHLSLDGFVAGPKGEMDWIKVDEEVFDYVGKRISKSTTALYGRVTYQMMESYWPTAGDKPNATRYDIEHARWYNSVYKVVLSRTMKDAGLSHTTVISNNLADGINEMKQSHTDGDDEILIFGSPTATHSLIRHNLIDAYWLFVNPIVLGQGIPLFVGIKGNIKLKLLPATRQFACGVTELNYSVEK